MWKRYLGFSAFLVLASICAKLPAKVIDITLGELVKQADLIAYGYSVTATNSVQNTSITYVSFTPAQILKGPKSFKNNVINICKMQPSSESYDLATIKGNYIVFGSLDGKCYRPVHWVSSIIKIENDMALTSEISGQPDEQPLAAFLKKIASATKKPKP